MSSKNSSKLNVPEAKAAMDKFKMEAASEVGVNLKNGYNGDQPRGRLCRRPDGQEDDTHTNDEFYEGGQNCQQSRSATYIQGTSSDLIGNSLPKLFVFSGYLAASPMLPFSLKGSQV